ncbi:hypothetical protein BH24ACT3_BH24ACT3_15030 [soil metagenome]
MEFLGDAVLGMAVADHVYRCYPDLPEGWLSRARAAVVRATALAEMATDLRLGDELRLGKGEAASGGPQKPSILYDAMEAVIGAVYLDGGFAPTQELVLRLLGGRIAALPGGSGDQDDKSRLQELAVQRFPDAPVYELGEDGPEHDKHFVATVRLGGAVFGHGEGRSKKQAEQAAARQAWERLLPELDHPDTMPGPVGPGRESETSDA